MTEQEYNERLKQVEKTYKDSLNDIYRQFAFDLRKYKVGDIIKNNVHTIIVESFSVYKMYGLPQPVYIGRELNKKLEPRKDGNKAHIYGNDNIELIKERS